MNAIEQHVLTVQWAFSFKLRECHHHWVSETYELYCGILTEYVYVRSFRTYRYSI